MSIRRDLLMRSALLRLPDLAALRAIAPVPSKAPRRRRTNRAAAPRRPPAPKTT